MTSCEALTVNGHVKPREFDSAPRPIMAPSSGPKARWGRWEEVPQGLGRRRP